MHCRVSKVLFEGQGDFEKIAVFRPEVSDFVNFIVELVVLSPGTCCHLRFISEILKYYHDFLTYLQV